MIKNQGKVVHTKMKKNTIMPTLIRDWAKKKPDAIFAEETSGEKITFREMHEEAIRVASALNKNRYHTE